MKLTIKELAPYLPYGLKMIYSDSEGTRLEFFLSALAGNEIMECEDECWNEFKIKDCKPILRPLSNLTKEIEHNGEKFVPIEKIKNNHIDYFVDTDFEEYILDRCERDLWVCTIFLPYGIIELLLEWHFDVFGLIPAGLAIDKNTL